MGALAVALGIGAAVATGLGIGVARAETGAAAVDASTTAPEATSSDPTGEPARPSSSDASDANPAESSPSVPRMNLAASGGEDNSINDVGQITDATDDDELERGTTSTTTSEPEEIPIVDTVPVPETPPARDISSVKPAAPAAHNSAHAPRSNPPAADDIAGNSPGFQNPPSSTGVPSWASLKVLPDNGDAADLGDHQRQTSVTTDGAELATTRTSLTMQASEDPPVGVPGSLAGATTTLVGLFLSPFLAPGPAAPAEPPLLWAVLAWVRREVQPTVVNATPYAAAESMAISLSSDAAGLNPTYTVGTPDSGGVVTGVVTATQILDYPLVFTGSTELPTGLAIVNGDGTFTYTPYPWSRLAAAAPNASETGADQQSFTVTVDDLNGDVASVLVTVPVSPDSDPYGLEPISTVGTPDVDGVVTGVMSVAAWVDYPVFYSGSTVTPKGSFVVNPDGTFTYTPTAAARQAAAASDASETGADRDSFTVTVNDGGTDVALMFVSVPISPDEAPEVDPVVIRGDGMVAVVTVPEIVDVPVVVTASTEPTQGDAAAEGTQPSQAPTQRESPRSSHVAKGTAPITPPLRVQALHAPAARPAPTSTATASDPVKPLVSTGVLVNLQVAFFALVTMLGGEAMLRGIGGLAVPAASGGAGMARVAAVTAGNLKQAAAVRSIGDASRSWRWPGTRRIDAAMRALPVRLASFSPLLARVVVDGSSVRAILGAGGMLLPAAGVLLGAAVLHNTGGVSTPPAVALLTAVAVLGVFDALAGFLAVTVFIAGVAIAGHLGTAAEIRTMLGMSVIWFAVPLIAGAARPLRRSAAQNLADWRAWVGDLTIASLIGAWAIQKMIDALPALAGVPLSITTHATKVALIVLGACALRIVLEAVAVRWYPNRLAEVQPESLPQPIAAQRIAAAVVRTGLLLFVASAFLGWHWQLWVGGLLFVLPQVLSVFEGHLPNSARLYRLLPRGIVRLVLMLVVGVGIGALVHRTGAQSENPLLDSFLFLAIPCAVLSGLELFGREGPSPDEGWGRWLAGAGFLVAGLWLVLFALP